MGKYEYKERGSRGGYLGFIFFLLNLNLFHIDTTKLLDTRHLLSVTC
jgi:hypothetical protein